MMAHRPMFYRFLVASWGVAAVALAFSVMTPVFLGHAPLFEWLLGLVADGYSNDGMISAAGVSVVRQVVANAGRLCGFAAVGAVLLALSLRRVIRGPTSDEAQGATGQQASRTPLGGSPRWYGAIALGLVVIGAALRVPRLFTSLFYDEVFTIQHFASLPLASIPFTQMGLNNHVLNSMLLHAMLAVSSAEWLLRLPSYVAGVASLWLFFLLARHLGGPLTGLMALWLAVVSPYHLWGSTLARGYMLGLCLTLLSLLVLVRAGSPPSQRVLWTVGITQVLASLAMPTVALVPLLFLLFTLLGGWPSSRRLVGIDPRSPTGASWLVTALWTVTVILLINLPMVPFLILVHVGGLFEGPWAGAVEWLSLFRWGPVAVLIAVGFMVCGAAEILGRRWQAAAWQTRLLLVVFSVAFLLFFAKPVPARAHVVAFAGLILLVAAGLSWFVMVAVRRVPVEAKAWTAGLVSCGLLAGIAWVSEGEMVEAARGMPLQDVRGAVHLAESVLPPDGVVVTSGFADREIAYYAASPVRQLAPTDDPARLLAEERPFCYFRLCAGTRHPDPIYDFFEASGPPMAVMPGQDPISVWCSGGSA